MRHFREWVSVLVLKENGQYLEDCSLRGYFLLISFYSILYIPSGRVRLNFIINRRMNFWTSTFSIGLSPQADLQGGTTNGADALPASMFSK